MHTVADAGEDDLPGILAIYNEVIAHSTAVYQEEPVSLENRRAWLQARAAQGFPVLVARDPTGVVGFASFGEFRQWPCYRNTVEHSVHVRADCRGRGIGRSLVEALLERGRATGKHVMVAGIDAGNIRSIDFHARLGFVEVARMPEIGAKFGRRLDLVLMQRFVEPAL